MERRPFLTGTVFALSTSIAGCLDSTERDEPPESTDDHEDGSDNTSTTTDASMNGESNRDSTPSKRSDMNHSVYVENQTDQALCISVVIETDDRLMDDSYLVTGGQVIEFAAVLTGDVAAIRIETGEYDHQVSWTSGDCPHEGSFYRSVAVRITANGIESAIDQCDSIVAGPYDEVTDATDAELCGSLSTDGA